MFVFFTSCTNRIPLFELIEDEVVNNNENNFTGYKSGDIITNFLYADTVFFDAGVIDSYKAVNGVRGAGLYSGSLDVAQLNYIISNGNFIILKWKNKIVLNGPGKDFVVFENGFKYSGYTNRFFMDLIIVSVSTDAENWVDFPVDYTFPVESVYTDNPGYWVGFAGKTPVLYNEDSNKTDPFNESLSGGDGFDLEDLPDTDLGRAIKSNGFRYIKLTTAPSCINPDTGTNFVKDGMSNGADIDGVYARYFKIE